jgi:predicted esterase
MWKKVLEHDVLLALPQSSEITGPNTFTWLNIDDGLKELKEIYSQIIEKYRIDLGKVFLSGSSIGGNLALEATFVRPKFSTKGFIAVNPALIQPDAISKNFERANKENVRGCIVVGSKDPEYEKIKELMNLLTLENVETKFYEIHELGHAFPGNFDELLEEMMEFLLGN